MSFRPIQPKCSACTSGARCYNCYVDTIIESKARMQDNAMELQGQIERLFTTGSREVYKRMDDYKTSLKQQRVWVSQLSEMISPIILRDSSISKEKKNAILKYLEKMANGIDQCLQGGPVTNPACKRLTKAGW